jgi:hypothetical protein
MPNYVTIKLKTGKDLVGIIEHDEEEFVMIDSPLEISIDPVHGMFAKSWLLLSEENSVVLYKEDIYYVQSANNKAVSYYEDFKARISDSYDEPDILTDDDYASDLEEMYETLLESRSSTKH